jgi:phage tail protein X
MEVRTQQGDTVDGLCWRQFGRTAGLVEKVLEMNAGLADYGPILPQGLVVQLPDKPATTPTAPLLQLWD